MHQPLHMRETHFTETLIVLLFGARNPKWLTMQCIHTSKTNTPEKRKRCRTAGLVTWAGNNGLGTRPSLIRHVAPVAFSKVAPATTKRESQHSVRKPQARTT